MEIYNLSNTLDNFGMILVDQTEVDARGIKTIYVELVNHVPMMDRLCNYIIRGRKFWQPCQNYQYKAAIEIQLSGTVERRRVSSLLVLGDELIDVKRGDPGYDETLEFLMACDVLGRIISDTNYNSLK